MAGKGPSRRKGSDDKKFRKNFDNVFNTNKDFEETFMQKTAAETKPINGKYFINEDKD